MMVSNFSAHSAYVNTISSPRYKPSNKHTQETKSRILSRKLTQATTSSEKSKQVVPDDPPPVDQFNRENIHSHYKLVKMDTRTSIDSYHAINAQQYKIVLQFPKEDIELIRYTWYQMLLDEETLPNSNKKPPAIPGTFPGEESRQPRLDDDRSSNSGISKMVRYSSSAIASSLFCRQFYANLLAMAPELEKLFPSIRHQAVNFAGVMSLAVSQLENLNVIENYLINLGKRHSRILDIDPANYELMGEALILTFHQRFGIRFTQELETLWIKLYLYLSNSLIQFGIDPILKVHPQAESRAMSTSTSTRNSMMMDDADDRRSISTQSSSVMSLNNNHNSKSTGGQTITSMSTSQSNSTLKPPPPINAPAAAIAVDDARNKKKFGRIRRKGKDCVIM
ncbi:uncharacterized protein J8A68_005195 [[Candida] subhashii]|uniref:Globin domain-containing protein n=1 Tax=[Candida] subhashii TaxID=561895 RepID=A0A8J5QFQ7_9ASCO|nr:uncharacterized protein J8A68_005195 [[Candida] subhashii]KAG7661303.1 hypothetical protein J8A68_005195 [[Candida] subhashii]